MTGLKHGHLRKLLVMDTSTAAMTIAVLDGDQLLGESIEKVEQNHSSKLLPAIRELVSSLGLTMKDIDGVAAGRGPGSYTGVRISVTVSKTFAWSLQIPLIGISSLEALAYGALDQKLQDKGQTQWIVPLMDARRGQVYTGIYGASRDIWQCHVSDGIRLMDNWIENIVNAITEVGADEQPQQIVFVGNADHFHGQIQPLSNYWSGEVLMLNQDIRAYDLGRLAQQRWMQGEQEEVHYFAPNYTQLAEAEANLMAKRKKEV